MTAELVGGDDGTVLVAAPDGPPRGTLVLLHDIFGLSDYVDDVAADLTARGWLVVAPALFFRDGVVRVAYDDIGVGSAAAARLSAAHVLADFDACRALAATRAPAGSPVVALGFCLGGSLASYLATERPLDVCVSFYGGVVRGEAEGMPSLLDSVADIGAPWLGIYGEDDPFIPIEDVRELEERAGAFRTPADIATYPGGHAFHRHTTPDYYHPGSAPLAWERAMGWLDRYAPAAAERSDA